MARSKQKRLWELLGNRQFTEFLIRILELVTKFLSWTTLVVAGLVVIVMFLVFGKVELLAEVLRALAEFARACYGKG